MRELRVEDALLYLDQVKMEFGDRPQIYNEFLDIMKTFKTQQIDTPGVIRRVSTLFKGNKNLVLGFNTFLPEGYKIELPLDGDGPPVAVYRAPGQPGVTHILGPAVDATAAPSGLGAASAAGVQSRSEGVARAPGPGPHAHGPPPHQAQAQQQFKAQPQKQASVMGAPPPVGSGGMVVDQSMSGAGTGGQFQPHLHVSHQQAMQMQQAQQRGQQAQQQMTAEQQGRGNGQEQQPGRPSQHHQPGGMPPVGLADGSAPSRMGPGGPQRPPTHPGLMPHPHHAQVQAQAQAQQQGGPPVEFDHAINYVTTIKKRFASEPDIYKKFLEILHTYQKEQRGIKDVLDEVSDLFSEHPDLLKEFTYFLPDAVQAQAKAQLDQVAKESEMRKRAATSKQAIMQTARGMQLNSHGLPPVRAQPALATSAAAGGPPTSSSSGYTPAQAPIPFGATQGRSEEREREICRAAAHGIVSFAPIRPPRRGELSAAQAAVKNGRPKMIPVPPVQPSTAESAFFERAKLHLSRKELAPDKPPGSRRHTPYTEFLKCLHLYGAGILNKEELFLLLRGLFMQGHAPKSGANAGGGASNPTVASDAQELLREFEEIMVGRGPYADQETMLKDKSKYGAVSSREFDASHCERPTPSYRTYPSDYPHNLFFAHSGQTEADASVLNSTLICAPDRSSKKRGVSSPEDYDAVRVRRNAYEEAMFRVEDEKFEVDMAIERNIMAMRQVEGLAEEVTQLRENEEKDGQPIGRMTYSMRSRTLNGTQVNAIARLYGEKGDEVIQHLVRTPVAVLPIVYQRLREKEVEWRKAKAEMSKRWKPTLEENFRGSLDVLCYFYKKEIERSFLPERLVEECKEVGHFRDEPESVHPATRSIQPHYAMSNPDMAALLFQPHLRVNVGGAVGHKDAFQCIALQCMTAPSTSSEDHERMGRIWSEFMVPFFSYPINWVLSELRESLHTQSSVVKYAPGQFVKTVYGDAEIVVTRSGVTYKVAYPYGNGFIRASAIVHALCKPNGTLFARSNGAMKRIEYDGNSGGESKQLLPESYSLLFATEAGFLFLRLYCLLVSILSDAKKILDEKKKNAQDAMDVEKVEPLKESDHSYSGVIQNLKKLLEGDIDFKSYESYCREAFGQRVYQLAAVPKLVKSCSEALLDVAQEDLLLALFDRCQPKGQNPLELRKICRNVSEDAEYRIQFDTAKQWMYFSHLPADAALLTSPQEVSPDPAAVDQDTTMHTEDPDGDLPPTKRPKFF